MRSLLPLLCLLLFCASCSKDSAEKTDQYSVTMHYHDENAGVVTDSLYMSAINTLESGDTLKVTYYWVNGLPATRSFTEKHSYADSTVYIFDYSYPYARLVLYPANHKMSFREVYDSRPAGDNFWHYYQAVSN